MTQRCAHCSSTNFYLMDEPGLGPCVCCTPEALASAHETIASLENEDAEAQAKQERDEALAILGTAGDHLSAYLLRLGLSPRAVKLDDPDLDALIELLGD